MLSHIDFTVLTENVTHNTRLSAEHGLSILITCFGKGLPASGFKILLDGGQSDIFMKNATALGLDISEVDAVVLSHGHYDHANGLVHFYQQKNNINIPLYSSCHVFAPHWSKRGGEHDIGADIQLEKLAKIRYEVADELQTITDSCFIVPHNKKFLFNMTTVAQATGMLTINEEGKFVPDNFLHEISLVLDTTNGLVIFNSCSHVGLEQIFAEIKELFPFKKIRAFIGGLHLATKDIKGNDCCRLSIAEWNRLEDCLVNHHVSQLFVGHCTGGIATYKLQHSAKFRGVVEQLECGYEGSIS